MNATDAVLMCCDRPMSTVPARPQDAPFTELWLCRECGHFEPVEPDDVHERCDDCGAELEAEPDMRYDRPLCPSCAETLDSHWP